MREVFIGFDSAWTDSSKNPGAITGFVIEDGGPGIFFPPSLATFDQAARWIEEWSADADYVLIAIDQPTVVPNHDGCRPVDRVAGSLVSSLRGGVQPARRGGSGASMFGDSAPIWRFLSTVGAVQNPIEARNAAAGRYVMEVFPALALPAIVPALWARRGATKYNPDKRKNFDPLDWRIVASGVASFAHGLAAPSLAGWLDGEAGRDVPRKADQDQLDAAICLAIGLAWRHGPLSGTLQIGDEQTGYMATIASAQTRAVLVKAATKRDVAIDRVWAGSASGVTVMNEASRLPVTQPAPSVPSQAPRVIPSAVRVESGPARVDPAKLRDLLVRRARLGRAITYGEVAAHFGHRWSQGVGASLTSALRVLAAENETAGEPLLMCLVVSKETRIPGEGFYECIGNGGAGTTLKRRLFDQAVERCRVWPW
jgi:predicted RNase H-like nuclease